MDSSSKILNTKVSHIKCGEGTIVAAGNESLEVKFEATGRVMKFLYPDSFDRFLKAMDPECEKMIQKDLCEKHKKKEKEASAKAEQFRHFNEELSAQHRETLLKRKKALEAKEKREAKERKLIKEKKIRQVK